MLSEFRQYKKTEFSNTYEYDIDNAQRFLTKEKLNCFTCLINFFFVNYLL